MLIDLMAMMAHLHQGKRIERIMQGLENRRARSEKVGGKGQDQKKWEKVAELFRRCSLKMEEIARIADVGVATSYHIKRELS
jgi:DNA invertase Pin-like site-specific DNA recombinase